MNRPSGRLENLDALRGLAATAVLLQHLAGHVIRGMPTDEVWLKAIAIDYFDWGRFGVVLFFLISGYVIPLSFNGPHPAKKFIISRAFRLYPAYWLSVLAVALVGLAAGDLFTLKRVTANLTMAYPLFGEKALTGVYWTLIIELGFYVLAFLLFVTGSLNNAVVVAGIGVAAVASAAIPSAAGLMGYHFPTSLVGYHLSFLLLGCVFRLARERAPYGVTSLYVLGGTIALALPLIAGLGQGGNPNFSIATASGAIMAIAAAVALFVLSWSPAFSRQPSATKKLGQWSYSIYLFHEPLAEIVSLGIHPDSAWRALAFCVITIGASVAVAAAVYGAVEAPAIRAGKYIARMSLSRQTGKTA